MLHELSRHEHIIGMKACNTDMYHFLQVVAGVDASFAVLSGEDTLFPLQMAAGAQRRHRRHREPAAAKPGAASTSCVARGRTAEALALHRRADPAA